MITVQHLEELRQLAARSGTHASDYYRNKAGRVVADRFLEEFYRAAVYLAANPEIASPAENGHRAYPLHLFPYWVVHVISGSKVRILVVRHHRRRPSFGARRK